MDLSTIRRKLDAHEYPNAQGFFADFKLMIRNCFLFNPPGTPVNQAGIDLQRLFDEKWKNLPQPKPQPSYDDDMDAEDDESEDDNHQRLSTRYAPCNLSLLTSLTFFRYCRDGETNRGHAGYDFRSETTAEREATEEAGPSTASARSLLIKQAGKGFCIFFEEAAPYQEVGQEERRSPW